MYELGMDFLWATKNFQNETILLPAEKKQHPKKNERWKFYIVPIYVQT